MRFRHLPVLGLLALLPSLALAQGGDGKEKGKDIMDSTNWREWSPDPVPVLTPEESMRCFRIAPGFRIELVAAEPLVRDPVFAQFDERGRLWVCEFGTYMIDLDGSDENVRTSRVVVLEDTDGDGRMDRSTAFVDDMINPRSLVLVEGGVLIAESGKLWFCEDTDGDLKCDRRREIMEFAKSALGNIEHSENALCYGLDNWMYNSTSSRRLRWQGGEVLEQPAPGRGQWGMAHDAYGRLYHNSNSRWFSSDWKIYDGRGKSPGAPDGRVYPIRPTTALNRAYKPGMLNEKGQTKSVTTISGLAVHSHGSFGEEWEGAIFSMSPGTNSVGAFLPDKPFPETTRYEHRTFEDPDWEKREFLASTEERFRPVNATTGPDGCLYLVDLHRGVIQHKRFLTSYLRKQSAERELDKPIGLGRIYRIVREGAEVKPRPTSLLEGLGHPYLWWRMRAQQRIVEADRKDLVPPLRELAASSAGTPHARVHALWSLEGLGGLDEPTIRAALRDDHWFVSMTALRLSSALAPLPLLLPDGIRDEVEKVASSEHPGLLTDYAEEALKKGFPSRIHSSYRDKEAGHLKKDGELLASYRKGRDLYGAVCGVCHQPDGKGKEGLAPLLAGSDWVEGEAWRVIAVTVHGLSGPIKVNGKEVSGVPPIMPPHSFLADEQLADILTYVRNAWGNEADRVTPKQIEAFRAEHKDRVLPWTEAEL